MAKHLIKRYENRKLYDKEGGKYISLEEIAQLIREGEQIRVVDNATRRDITSQTLTQIILKEGKQGKNPLSSDVLHEIIRRGGSFFEESVKLVRTRLDSWVPEPISRLVNGSRDFDALQRRIEELEKQVKGLHNTTK
ncbi:MAG TPA: polyhydroxyalkanoate synthesis regulator DNA-binding domain-containing protein [Balneolales bacterium]|nr:polyhydroxyalkanoate synthesis regulator DNA-binding domain-containing protein [Balneolales bacterium]